MSAAERGAAVTIPADDDVPEPDFDTPDSVQTVGRTIGVVEAPKDPSVSGRLAWLRGQVREACAVGWINDLPICQRLLAHLSGAAGLRAASAELSAQRGKHVNETAFALVTSNISLIHAMESRR